MQASASFPTIITVLVLYGDAADPRGISAKLGRGSRRGRFECALSLYPTRHWATAASSAMPPGMSRAIVRQKMRSRTIADTLKSFRPHGCSGRTPARNVLLDWAGTTPSASITYRCGGRAPCWRRPCRATRCTSSAESRGQRQDPLAQSMPVPRSGRRSLCRGAAT